jgi:hypothetical protein
MTRSTKNIDSEISPNYKILILSSYFSASQNGTSRQTDESWCLQKFHIAFTKMFSLANSKMYDVDSDMFLVSGKDLYSL